MLLPTLFLLSAFFGGPQETPDQLATSPSTEASVLDPNANLPQRLVIHGGRIYLGNESGGVVEAMLIEDGRVVSSGPLAGLGVDLEEEGLGVIDLRGALAIPGLQDAHGSMEPLGATEEQVDLRGANTFAEVVERVAEAAKNVEVGTWIEGWGWDEAEWETPELPSHGALSEAVPSHPVILHRIDRDAVLVNRQVLEAAGLDEGADVHQRIPGGVLVLDEENRSSGLFLGNAQKLVTLHRPTPSLEQVEARLLRAQDRMLELGVTCVHDMHASPLAIQAYLGLRERGLLKIRIVAYLNGNDGFNNEVFAKMPYPEDRLDLLRVSGVSFRLDSSLAARGAALLEDYTDRPGERGRLFLTESELTNLVHQAWQAGLQPAVGAVGDLANRAALNAFDGMLQVDEDFAKLRPRIEHVELISPRDFDRFPGIGVTPSMQPIRRGSTPEVLLERLGEYRIEGARTWRSQAPGWMQVAYGSQFPVNDPNPLLGLQAAREHHSPEPFSAADGEMPTDLEDTTAIDALAGYTRGPSYAAHQEADRGQLLPGYWADMTVLDTDPVEGPSADLRQAKVLLTLINGRIAYQQ